MNPFRTMSGEAMLTLSCDISLNEAARRESDERIITGLGLSYDSVSHNVSVNEVAHARLCQLLIAAGQDSKTNERVTNDLIKRMIGQIRAVFIEDFDRFEPVEVETEEAVE